MSTARSEDERRRLAETDDLHISPLREDGKTYGTPTWIWFVVVDGALYVRSHNGKSARWYKAALKQKAGRITAAGIDEGSELRACRRHPFRLGNSKSSHVLTSSKHIYGMATIRPNEFQTSYNAVFGSLLDSR